jgi:hypothetical protein
MSIFNWFSRKQPTPQHPKAARSGGTLPDAARFSPTSDTARDKPAAPVPAPSAAHLKTDRLEQREHLDEVVRDSMLRAGVLGARYKFKVVSPDGRAGQFLIMIDLADTLAGDTARLAEIEATMAQIAKLRHGILITAVYWRLSEQVTAGLAPHQAVTPAPATAAAAVPQPAASGVPAAKGSGRFEPLAHDEILAFKRAAATTAPGAALSASGEIVAAGRRQPAPSTDFEDTQMMDSD